MTQIYYVASREGIDKIYRMGTDGSSPEVVYDNQDPGLYIGKIALSPDGKTLAFAGERDVTDPMDHTIYLLGLRNNTQSFLTMGDWPDWSPDGKKIVFQRETGQHLPDSADVEIFTIDIATGTEIQLTNEPGSSYSGNPACSPDGSTIAYSRFTEGEMENCSNMNVIYLMDSSGNQIGPLTCQTDSPSIDIAPSWSHEGSEIAFIRQNNSNRKYQLHKVTVTAQTVTKLTDSNGEDYEEYPPSWSYGNTIALSSQRDGDFDIWMVDSKGGGYLTNLTGSNPSFDLFPAFGW
jgi:Tol biopolymer transport system component